ncbi:RtcB family protein [Intrasporangium calvum]|uniref:3'-phosphate/5'-hydroxy nucleic acid ligase n=1 Tax=Intrasporangium calvum TaxID=53358 RepID=A0ABT5GK39_9MICO|nr:RtcB family protein [Intrasporangium calvum]MDC5698454.1 RtcB family protein [Intrasporangium calvum]
MQSFPVALPGAAASTLMWADPADVEPAAQDQLRNISALPWVHGVRVMPDVHLGMGATVGSVIAMRDAVSPAAVGVDIGCGMTAVRTSLTASDLPDDLGPLRAAVEAVMPVGWAAHNGSAPILGRDRGLAARADSLFGRFGDLTAPKIAERRGRAMAQCGSLGSGNHFWELCEGDDGRIWLMLHSGSRNIGKELADRHITTAKTLEHNLGLPDRDLAVFLAGTEEMAAYLHDLYWAQEYALLNREVMMASTREVVAQRFPQVTFDEPVRCHHNYVSEETYDGVDVIVTRKGAIRAGAGDLGLIPGSMGTGSYVVRGLGNEQSFNSASHGAGRRMSRNAAKRTFTVEDLRAQTEGVECRKDAGVLDEIPGAYKDLESVIAAQTMGPSPLVEVVARLTTLLCVKG